MKTTKEQRNQYRKMGSAYTSRFPIFSLIDDIDELESLVQRQAELLERVKDFLRPQIGSDPCYDKLRNLLKDLEALGGE